jgi:hypothetical protein
LSFETGDSNAPAGWSAYRPDDPLRGLALAVDSAVAAAGARSLRLEQQDASGFTRIGQRLRYDDLVQDSTAPSTLIRRVRLRAAVRTAAADTAAGLWLRVAGAKGAIYLDSRSAGHEGADAATAHLASPGNWAREELEVPLPADGTEVAFGALLRGRGSAWFDDFSLEVVDVGARPPPATAAARYLDDALTLLEHNSINTGRIDWRALRAGVARQAGGADTPAGVYSALRYAIYELGDRHSYLLAPHAQAALDLAPVSNARTGRARVAPLAERVDGTYGYLAVPGFAGGAPQAQVQFAEELQASIRNVDMPATCGWILDLRFNSGGNLWPMLAGVGPLLGDGEAGASVYPDGQRKSFWYRDGQAGFGDYAQLRVREPYRLAGPPPVAVLLGPGTASSAEVLAVAFRGRAHARSFGAPTAGLSAGNRTFVLADGASLVLTVAATADRTGRVYADAIEPEQPDEVRPAGQRAAPVDTPGGERAVPVETRPARGRGAAATLDDPEVRAAAHWLAAEPACAAAR